MGRNWTVQVSSDMGRFRSLKGPILFSVYSQINTKRNSYTTKLLILYDGARFKSLYTSPKEMIVSYV